MNDLIQRIVAAIFRQEGMPADYPNPGNLRGAPWLLGAIVRGGFWRPENRNVGVAGAAHLVALRIAEGFSLQELIAGQKNPITGKLEHGWAPASNNNQTLQYIANVKKWANIPDENQPLWNYLI